MSEETLVHILPEEKYLIYLIKISEEKRLIHNLLFKDPYVSGQEHILADLCEGYASLYKMGKILEEAEDSFSTEKHEFYITNDSALKFIFYLSSIITIKEKLPMCNISFSLH